MSERGVMTVIEDGKRVEDKVEWALEILGRYSPISLTSVAGPV